MDGQDSPSPRQFPSGTGSRDNVAGGPTLLERGDFEIEQTLEQAPRRLRIRCPHCGWQPSRGSMWTCLPIGHPEYFKDACGTSWNTFDTRGLCPGCSHQWLHTSCLVCGRWALHEDWYERAGEGQRSPR